MSDDERVLMAWKVGAVLVLVVSLIGVIVRIQDRDYIYLSASLVGLGIAIWLWKKGDAGRARVTSDDPPD